MHPMELLDDEAQVEARFGPCGDSANLDERYVHGLRRTYYRLRNHFRCTRWCSKVMRLWRKLILVFLEIVLIPMVLLGDERQVETRFGPFRDSVNLDAR
jgi:hypothetical protein